MKALIWIVAVLIILGGVWWYFSMPVPVAPMPTPTIDTTSPNPATTTDNATTSSTTPSTGASGDNAPMTATVIYSAQGFTPATVTVPIGGTVKWINQSGTSMWVATNEHPSHTIYAGTTRQQHCPDANNTAFDQCAPGNEYSFTFSKAGSWKYHDHMNAIRGGTVIVK